MWTGQVSTSISGCPKSKTETSKISFDFSGSWYHCFYLWNQLGIQCNAILIWYFSLRVMSQNQCRITQYSAITGVSRGEIRCMTPFGNYHQFHSSSPILSSVEALCIVKVLFYTPDNSRLLHKKFHGNQSSTTSYQVKLNISCLHCAYRSDWVFFCFTKSVTGY
jgi:hypothetical protein